MNAIAPIRQAAGRTTHFINGKWSEVGGRTFDDHNPFDGEVFARVAAGGRAEAEAAVAAADAAFPAWAAMTPRDRQRLFLKAAEILESRTQEILRVMALETGAGAAFTMFQVSWSADLLRQAASWGYLPVGDILPSDQPGRFAMAVRKPLGVVAGFTPWNGAFSLAFRTVVLPMVFGNTVVLKPSEEAPLSAGLLIAEILEEAGFPPGTINVVTHAPGEAGPIADVFFESPAVRSINFTGSSATGRMLAGRAGQALKRIVLELGGYNPMLILDDANLDNAVNVSAFSGFFHQGQICMNARKILVDRKIHDAFVEKLAAKAVTIKSGDPTTPGVVIGPLINAKALALVEDRVKDALDRGARLVTGGTAEGRNYAPTILTHVPADAPITREETFGPVVVIEAVDNAEEALAKAMDTPYGLCASIMTGDQDRGLELAQRFNCGHGPHQRSDHGERTFPAQRRGQGQRLGSFRSLRDRGFHGSAADDDDPRREPVPVLSLSGYRCSDDDEDASWRTRNVGSALFAANALFEQEVLRLARVGEFSWISRVHLALFRNLEFTGSRLTDIAARAGMTKQSMQALVDTAERLGVVARQPAPDDRRAKIVVFTPAGLRMMEQLRSGIAHAEQQFGLATGREFVSELKTRLEIYVAETGAARQARLSGAE